MNKLDQFIIWLLSWVNRAIYVWGGQGETITSTAQIYRMETSKFNAFRAIALWIKRGRNAVCFDCSGLLVKWLLGVQLIQYDTTADGLSHMCLKINKSDLKRGDWVFRMHNGKAYHIGVVVDADLNVVESMGRDDGVVKRGLDQHSIVGYWTDFGRPLIFKTEIEYVAPEDNCPYAEPKVTYKDGVTFKGDDAGWYQWQLNKRGYGLVVDKIAGAKTWVAINSMQSKTGVGVGNAGPRTRNVIRT
jgi:hypothetical protein